MEKKKLLIYGGGAIGRGYIPWIFPQEKYNLFYVDSDKNLQKQLREKKKFTTYKTAGNSYEKKVVRIKDCFLPGEETSQIPSFDAIITAVGPRNIFKLQDALQFSNCPVILFENDSGSVGHLRELVANPQIYFGIPDVITSNTAPEILRKEDPLSIVTEDGTCFIDERAASIGGNVVYASSGELEKQWIAKLYIHNTPHCIAAYLGFICQKTWLHEGMALECVNQTVKGAMLEMCEMVKKRYALSEEFVSWYSRKELQRFANPILYDPLARVAREPFRKLAPDNRLIGAAQLALSCGIVPNYTLKGIISAFMYNRKDDPDFNIYHLMNALNPGDFLQLIIQLQSSEALYKLLIWNWDTIVAELEKMKNGTTATT